MAILFFFARLIGLQSKWESSNINSANSFLVGYDFCDVYE
jgi:hypothetical protein